MTERERCEAIIKLHGEFELERENITDRPVSGDEMCDIHFKTWCNSTNNIVSLQQDSFSLRHWLLSCGFKDGKFVYIMSNSIQNC